MKNVIEVKGLNKTFKGGLFEKPKQILFDVSFNVPQGLTTGFIGNNGSGKTTTIKSIFEFIQPDSGEVLFFNQKLSSRTKKKIGYLPERPYLYEFLTGMEFLKFHWDLCQNRSRKDFIESANRVLKQVNLFDARDKRLRNYSKGMMQRIGIAQAIINDPELLIFDEPMSGLDPDGRFLVKEILREEHKKGVTLFFSSHLLADMEDLCEHLVVIDQGKIIFNGELKKFMQNATNLEVAFQLAKTGKEHL